MFQYLHMMTKRIFRSLGRLFVGAWVALYKAYVRKGMMTEAFQVKQALKKLR